MDQILAPSVYPFTVAAAVMLCLVVLEGLSLMAGHSASGLIDQGLGADHDVDTGDMGSIVGVVNWLNLGGIPFLALVILACAAFSALGYAIQSVAASLAGPLPVSLAAVAAFAGAVPATRYGSRVLGAVIPRDETYAVSLDEMVGLTGKVSVGPLDQGMPGSVTVTDRHRNRHSLRAVAAAGLAEIPQGAEVLLVDRSGRVFTAVPAPASLSTAIA